MYQQQISGSSSAGGDRPPDVTGIGDTVDAGNNSSSWSSAPKMGKKISKIFLLS